METLLTASAIAAMVPSLIPLTTAAAAMSVHPRTLLREAERGRLKTVRVGARRYVTPDSLKEYVTPR